MLPYDFRHPEQLRGPFLFGDQMWCETRPQYQWSKETICALEYLPASAISSIQCKRQYCCLALSRIRSNIFKQSPRFIYFYLLQFILCSDIVYFTRILSRRIIFYSWPRHVPTTFINGDTHQ